MKRLIPLAAALMILGAGCTSGNLPSDSYAYSPTPTPAPAPEPAAPSPTMNQKTYAFPGVMSEAEAAKKIRIKTNLGDIVVQTDPKAGPRAASNFVYLAKEGFYDGTIFHRVIPGFMIQGGDPTGTGMGGPGYRFDNDSVTTLATREVTTDTGRTLTLANYRKGILAMANAGPNTNGSQFFIMVDDYELPPDYSVFGRVIEGQEVADAIAAASRDDSDRPLSEVKMLSVAIEE